MKRISYFRLKKYLVEKLEYTPHEAVATIKDIRHMKNDLRAAFYEWFTTSKIPEGELNGVNFHALMEAKKLNPVATFLTIDWYCKEPALAKRYIIMPEKDVGYELVGKDNIDRTDVDDEDTGDVPCDV